MRMDVAVMTRNSSRFLHPCLDGVYKGIDVNRLIVVDGGSTDSTLEIAKSYGAEILNDGGTRLGGARKLAINSVKTPLFAFIDSDLIITEGWADKMLSSSPPDFGAIESLPLNAFAKGEERVTAVHNRVMLARYDKITKYESKTSRGFTGATILRRDIVKDVLIPNVPCCEDWVLTQHVIKKGYGWYRLPIPVLHYDRFSERPERITQTYAVGRALGFMTLPWLMRRTITALLGRLVVSLATRKPEYFLHRIRYSRNSFEGFLHPQRYLDLPYAGWNGDDLG